MDRTGAGLAAAGFIGFVPFADLPSHPVPPGPGVYLVVRPDDTAPNFLERSVGGWFKGKDPSVDAHELEHAWLPRPPCSTSARPVPDNTSSENCVTGWTSTAGMAAVRQWHIVART